MNRLNLPGHLGGHVLWPNGRQEFYFRTVPRGGLLLGSGDDQFVQFALKHQGILVHV